MQSDVRTRWIQAACLSVLAGLAVGLFLTSPTDGDFWWFDAPRHAMNGVFIRDFFLEGGLFNPIRYASDYYLKYPGINIGFYPPLFYFSSAPFLAVFGATHAVSQAVVVLYSLAAAVFAYLLCARRMDRLSALAVAACIVTLPEMALWTRQVQLDVPAVAVLLATAYSLVRHLEGGERKWLYATTILLGMAVLTRAQAVYAVPAILFFLFAYKYPSRPALRTRLAALIPLAILAAPSMLMVAYFSKINQSQTVRMEGMPELWSVENWVWYASYLPEQMGWPAVIVVIAGLIASVFLLAKKNLPRVATVLAVFCICSWCFFTLISNKEARFNLPSLPFLFLFCVLALYALLPQAVRILTPALAVWLSFQALTMEDVPVVTGFKEAAAMAQANTPPGGNVLVSAHRDGNFIYDMRTTGNRRDIGVRRADKMFVEIKIARTFGVTDKNLTEAEIVELLDRHKVATLVVQDGYLADLASMQNFQKVLDSGKYYRPIKTIDLRGATRPDERQLTVYVRR